MDNEHRPQPGHFFAYESHDGEVVTFTIPEDTDMPTMLRAFERYLRASGYVFSATATLDIVEENAR